MGRVAVLSDAAILDTSWLLELYQVPGHSSESRKLRVLTETAEFVTADGELFVTVAVLFELANHIVHVRGGKYRRSLAEKLLFDIRSAVDQDSPWTIATVNPSILLRPRDVVELAEKFVYSSGPNYSFADISIIDLAKELRHSFSAVKILEFDAQLKSYSD